MRRTALLCLPTALLLSACSSGGAEPAPAASESSTAPTATTEAVPPTTTAAPTTDDPLVADQALTRTLYYNYSQASNAGLDALAANQAASNHPEYAFTAEQCQQFLRNVAGLTDGYRVNAVPDVNAMALDPGWALPDGQYAGLVPAGRVYILPVEFSQTDLDVGLDDSESAQVHVAVLDGAAYFFQPCEEGA